MKVILWDWDNTLADTMDPLMNAFNETLKHYHLPIITREQMKANMNSAGSQIFLRLFPNNDLDEVRQIYLKHYQKNIFHLSLMSAAKETLKWTKEKGFINILASNKHYLILRKEVEVSALREYFDEICGAEQFSENKPSKIFTDAVLEKYQNWTQLFSVGDGVSDIKMAHNYSDGKAILVGTDPNTAEFKNNPPDFAVKKLNEVPDILQQFS